MIDLDKAAGIAKAYAAKSGLAVFGARDTGGEWAFDTMGRQYAGAYFETGAVPDATYPPIAVDKATGGAREITPLSSEFFSFIASERIDLP